MARKGWSKIIEEAGVQVRLFERGGGVYRDVAVGRTVSVEGKPRTEHDIKSLKTADRDVAEDRARAFAREWAIRQLIGHTPAGATLGHVFEQYRLHRVPLMPTQRAREAETRLGVFEEAWGRARVAAELSQADIDHYVRGRRSLVLVSRGLRLDEQGKAHRGYRKPRPIRDGELDKELTWLSSVFNWARGFRVDGARLLADNPLVGLRWPREKNPRRPVASHARYLATLDHVDAVDPAGRLRCILALARYTGRRESAICALRASDVLLGADRVRAALAEAGLDERLANHMPHGAVQWRAETDKVGFLFVSPLNQPARDALDVYLRQSPRLGDVPLFPAPGDPGAPLSRDLAAAWLLRAETLAGQPKLVGGMFHPFRRLWASERKHLPDVDVAAAGGWRDTVSLRRSYQMADPATVLRVVEEGAG